MNTATPAPLLTSTVVFPTLLLSSLLAVACVPSDEQPQIVQGLSHHVGELETSSSDELIRFGSMPKLPADAWQSRIVNGGPESAEPATALLLAFDQNQQVLGICSGTLIAPRKVLTAAHCIDDTIGAAGFAVYFGSDATLEDDPGFIFFTEATAVVFHPAWNPNDLLAGNDIGLVFLAQTPPITPIPIRTTPLSSSEVGQPLKLVGWGITGSGLDDNGRKRSTISELHDFDALLMQVGDASTGTCSGDSGGPAFMDVGGQIQVAGVTSFGDTNCAEASVDTRVDAFVSFINSDGQDPGGNSGNPGGFGASCAAEGDCASGLCAVFEDGSGFCTQACDGSATSCPDGFACVEAQPGLNACFPSDGGDDGGSNLPPPRDDDGGGCSTANSLGSSGTTGSGVLLLLAFIAIGWRRRVA